MRNSFVYYLFIFDIKVEEEEEEEYSVNFRAFDRKRHAQVLLRPIQLPPNFLYSYFFASVRQSETAASREDGSAKRTSPPPSIFFFFWPGVCWTQFSTRRRSVVYNDSIKLDLLIFFFFFYSFFFSFFSPQVVALRHSRSSSARHHRNWIRIDLKGPKRIDSTRLGLQLPRDRGDKAIRWARFFNTYKHRYIYIYI